MNLHSFAAEFADAVERVTDYGTASIKADGTTGTVTEFEHTDGARHFSVELENVSEAQMRRIFEALADFPADRGPRDHERAKDHSATGELV